MGGSERSSQKNQPVTILENKPVGVKERERGICKRIYLSELRSAF